MPHTPRLLFVGAAIAVPLACQLPTGNILVSTTFANTVREYTPAGALVQQFDVPYPGGQHPATEYVRDLAVHPSGDLYVFNGTFAPYLSVRRAGSGLWEHYTDPRWSTVNNVSYGGVALYGNSAFVADSFTAGGLFRFDLTTFDAVEFGTIAGFFDVAIGWDGLLYGLTTDGRTLHVFDPDTLAFVRTVVLQDFLVDARGIGVDRYGHLFVSTWGTTVNHYDANGNLLQSIPTGNFNLQDLDIDPCGAILVGNRFGSVYTTESTFGSITGFSASFEQTFVAFATANVPAPAIATARAGMPPNPQVFSGSGALLGTNWAGAMTPFLPGAIADLVAFGAGPANVPTPHGTLLFDELLTWFVYDASAGATISVAIPNECRLTGVTFVAQAASVSLDTHALANALDVRIGSF